MNLLIFVKVTMVVIGIAGFRGQGGSRDPTKDLHHISPEERLTVVEGFEEGNNRICFRV